MKEGRESCFFSQLGNLIPHPEFPGLGEGKVLGPIWAMEVSVLFSLTKKKNLYLAFVLMPLVSIGPTAASTSMKSLRGELNE